VRSGLRYRRGNAGLTLRTQMAYSEAEFEPRDPEPLPLPVHAQPRVAFVPQDHEADRLAVKRADEAEARANTSIPGIAASAIELARSRGQMRDLQ